MKILFITNYYPPFEVGGYEQLCRDVVERILARGHDVQVLTSDHGVGSQPDNDPPYVYRDLRLHIRYNDRLGIPMQFLWRRPRAAAHNLRCLRASMDRFAPDVVFFWNLQGLPRSIALEAESLSGPGTAYWLAGYSPAEPDEYAIYWSQPALKDARTPIKSLMAPYALTVLRREGNPVRPEMRHVAVVSEYMLRKGIADGTLPKHAWVIYNGVEIERFFRPVSNERNETLSLLQAGRVSADKGVHLAVQAIGYLARVRGIRNVKLCIAGSGPAEYLAELQKSVAHDDIEDQVSFLGWLPRESMPDLLSRCQVLLLPTIHQEPFARVVLEAMAGGLAVIGTLTGGTGELLEEGITGLTFSPDDSGDLARQIERLALDPGLRRRIATEGQKMVCERFSLEHMVDEVEGLLREAVVDQGRKR